MEKDRPSLISDLESCARSHGVLFALVKDLALCIFQPTGTVLLFISACFAWFSCLLMGCFCMSLALTVGSASSGMRLCTVFSGLFV